MMKELLKKLQKKSKKKGFTLVEIIVVLVILAILAAIAVPSVIGYVDEAKESRYIQEARSIYVVIQTEEAKALALDNTDTKFKDLYGTNGALVDTFHDQIQSTTTLDVSSIVRDPATSADADANKKATWTVKYTSDDGKAIKAKISKNKDITIEDKAATINALK